MASANKQSVKQKRARRRQLFAQGQSQTAGHLDANKVSDSDSSIAGEGNASDSVHTMEPQTFSETDLATVVVTSMTEIIHVK